MAQDNKIGSVEKRNRQNRRTHKNKIKKYEKLISDLPSNKSMDIWKQKLEHSRQKIK